MPGRPPSASTSSPESSPMTVAPGPRTTRPNSALMRAFDSYVSPVSSGQPSATSASIVQPGRSRSNSRALWALREASIACRSGEGNGGGLGLALADGGNARLGEGEELVERLARERVALRGRLHLDEPAVAGHDDVHVRVRVRVLGVVEVEERDAVGDADEALDLDRAALLLAARRLALDAVAGGRREERVLGGDPPAALVAQPARDLLLDHCGAEDDRLALRDERRAMRLLEVVRLDRERAQLVGTPSVGTRHAAAPSCASVTCSTSPMGSCRKRRPISRNAAGSPVVRKRYAPVRDVSFSMRLRASVSDTSRAVSSAEKTSVTSRPKTRWKTGRMRG